MSLPQRHFFIRCLLLPLLVMASLCAYASEEPYTNKLNGRIKAGDSCVVIDE